MMRSKLYLVAVLVLVLAVLAACSGGTTAAEEPADVETSEPDGDGSAVDDVPDGEPVIAPQPEPTQTAAPAPAPSPMAQATEPAPAPAPAPAGEPDGNWPALITRAAAGEVVLDRVELLSGAQARAAQAEDGVPQTEGGVDAVYLRNRNTRLRTIPVAADVRVRVYDCTAACALVDWVYADLVAGRALPYGNAQTPFTATVRDGVVVELSEVYSP